MLFIILFISCINLNAQLNSFEKFENIMLSPYTTSTLTLGWGITTYETISNPNQYYGTSEFQQTEQINSWAEHLHIGYGLHMIGAMWKNWSPETYSQAPYGLRFLCAIGGFIQMDDMYQHLYLHQHDDFDLDQGQTGTIASSPIHNLYLALEDTNRTAPFKMMFDVLQLNKFTLAAGYYQGPAGELSYQLFDFTKINTTIHANQIIGLQWNPKTQVMMEQCITGLSALYHITPWLNFEIGIGTRWLSNNQLLKNRFIMQYGLRIG